MNKIETITILRTVKALCPAQIVDKYTPDVWADALVDVSFRDAQEALRNISRVPLDLGKNFYVQPGHIIATVREIRADRARNVSPAAYGAMIPEWAEWSAMCREIQRRAGDGDYGSNPRGEVTAADVMDVAHEITPKAVAR